MRLLNLLLVILIVSIAGCESREDARRKQAANNLKQIGLALKNYRATNADPTITSESNKGDHVSATTAPKAEGTERQADKSAKVRGVVAEFHRSPEGEIDGIALKDGTEFRFPPRSGEKVAATVSIGDEVEIFGWTHAGESEVHAATITNATNGKAVEVDRPPPNLAE